MNNKNNWTNQYILPNGDAIKVDDTIVWARFTRRKILEESVTIALDRIFKQIYSIHSEDLEYTLSLCGNRGQCKVLQSYFQQILSENVWEKNKDIIAEMIENFLNENKKEKNWQIFGEFAPQIFYNWKRKEISSTHVWDYTTPRTPNQSWTSFHRELASLNRK